MTHRDLEHVPKEFVPACPTLFGFQAVADTAGFDQTRGGSELGGADLQPSLGDAFHPPDHVGGDLYICLEEGQNELPMLSLSRQFDDETKFLLQAQDNLVQLMFSVAPEQLAHHILKHLPGHLKAIFKDELAVSDTQKTSAIRAASLADPLEHAGGKGGRAGIRRTWRGR